MAPAAALYEQRGSNYEPLPAAGGPWLPGTQNGAAVGALMASVLEATPSRAPMLSMNLHLEYVRPVPMQTLRLTTRVVRDGPKLQILQASLLVNEIETVVATLTRLRSADLPVPQPAPAQPLQAPPADSLPRYASKSPYFQGVDCRPVSGGFEQLGPGVAWMRITGTIIAGQPPSPLGCAALFADAGSGLSCIVPRSSWSYPNVSLSLHLHRAPCAGWMLLHSQTFSAGAGVAQVHTTLSDERGQFGMGLQALILEPRSTQPTRTVSDLASRS